MGKLNIFSVKWMSKFIQQKERTLHNTEDGVGLKRHCPLLVKPKANNLLIQQQKQPVTHDHPHPAEDEILLILWNLHHQSKVVKNAQPDGHICSLIKNPEIVSSFHPNSPTQNNDRKRTLQTINVKKITLKLTKL